MLPDTHEVGIKVGLEFFRRIAAGDGKPSDLAQLLGPALLEAPAARAGFYHAVVAALQDYVRLLGTKPASASETRPVLATKPELIERIVEFITDENGMVKGAILSKKA